MSGKDEVRQRGDFPWRRMLPACAIPLVVLLAAYALGVRLSLPAYVAAILWCLVMPIWLVRREIAGRGRGPGMRRPGPAGRAPS